MFYKQRVFGKLLRSKRQRDLCQSQAQRSLFHYLALMYNSDPPQCCYYISIFANILYMIKLIHSITIILRVFMFYKQRVLANCWGRKDSAICASRKRSGACYCAVHMEWAINSLFMPTTLSFRPQKSAKTRCILNINMRTMILIDWIKNIYYQILAKIQL